MNFRKASIFQRDTEKPEEQNDSGGMLAVWGSPGSGKTVTAAKIAKMLSARKKNVILLLCDMAAPMLPCICPADALESKGSLAGVLAAARISENLIKHNLVTFKRNSCLAVLGLLERQNEYSTPPFTQKQVVELLDGLRQIAPYVIVDCGSYIANDILSAVALMEADSILRLANCDPKSVNYRKAVTAELETALSIITTAYLRSEDLQTAVEENINYLNPPVQGVFRSFLTRIKHIDPDVNAALAELKSAIDNEVWREWCEALSACQYDHSMKSTLNPIVAKLSDMRIINGELENLVFAPRKEFISMAALVVLNIPLLYFLNKDWYAALMTTVPGKAVLAVCAAAIFLSFARVVKLTQPIEYRR